MVRIKAGDLEDVQTFCCKHSGLWQRFDGCSPAQPAVALPAAGCHVSAVGCCRKTRKLVEAEISKQSFITAAGSGLEELHKQL